MATTSAAKRTAQVPLKDKISFAFAEFGSQFVWTTVSSYLLLYYTDVALIAPAAAGTIMLIARILDGIQDLGFGYIAERTHSRWGRFRPYVMFGAPFLTLSLIITFVNPASGSTGRIWYAGITYVLLCFVYTVVNMAYGSMAGVMTTDTEERLTLNWIRSQGSTVAQLLLNAVTMPMLLFFAGPGAGGKGYDARSFLMMAIIFGAVSLPMFFITGINSKEVITLTPEQQQVPFSQTVKAVLSNQPLMMVFATLLLNLVGLFGRIGTLAYFVIYNIGSPQKVAGAFLAYSVGTMIGQLVFPKMASFVGKARMVIISEVFGGAFLLGIYFLGQGSFTLFMVLQFLYGLSAFAAPITLSMIPDAVDYYENRHGIRADGTSYATVSLSTKVASAFGGAVGLYIMGGFGYDGAAQVQTDHAMTGINIAVNLVPAVLAFAAVIPMLFYRLNHKTMEQITAELEVKRAVQAEALAEGASLEKANAEAEEAVEGDLPDPQA